MIAGAKVYDLGQPYWPGMPVHPFDPPFQFYMYRYHEHTEKDLGKIEPGFGDAMHMNRYGIPTVNYGSAGRIRTGGGGFDTHQGEAVHIGDMYDIVKVYIQCILSMCGVVK